MEFHEVSRMPINLKTPSRMSLMTVGGALYDLISVMACGLMLPTAFLAS